MGVRRYLVIIEKAKRNFSAYAPDVPGCVATGKTLEEVKKNMQEALSFHLASLREDSERIPQAQAMAEYVEVYEELPEVDGEPVDSFEDSLAFFDRHREELLKDYEGKYVAIIKREVVDSDVDWRELAIRVYKKYGYRDIYMPKVERNPQPVRIRSPRRA